MVVAILGSVAYGTHQGTEWAVGNYQIGFKDLIPAILVVGIWEAFKYATKPKSQQDD